MTNKNTILLVALIIVIAGVGAYLLNQKMPLRKDAGTGKVIFGITDAAADMSGVSSVFITVNKIEIHSATRGWITASNETKQYDLLALKQSGTISLLADANVEMGTYDQVRLMVSKVMVVKNGVQQEAKLPSSELKIVGNIVVNAGKTLSVVFDFIADKSLHITGNGKLIFAPVIKVIKRSDVKVELKLNDELSITGGKEEDEDDVGMDEKGEVKNDFELKGSLNIDAENNIRLESKVEARVETENELVFNFTAQNNSGVSGTATLSEEDGDVEVTLKLKKSILGLLKPAEPAHIHLGSCANIGGIKYPLNSVVNGESETELKVSLADLKVQLPLAINVHKSAAEPGVYIACSDLSF